MTVLVTGGTGYIGSHAVVELLGRGYQVAVLDNLSNSSAATLSRIKRITGEVVPFVEGDIRDSTILRKTLKDYSIKCVMHFAGLKSVAESVSKPDLYYDNNVAGTLELLKAMRDVGTFEIIFSSSATVYGRAVSPISESFPVGRPENPYGRSKLMAEDLIRDMSDADPRWRAAILRYFNPAGAHPSGLIGEEPRGVPNNLVPFITQVALGKLPSLAVYGKDYPTPDGSGVRDYIHIMDLAKGHLAALRHLKSHQGVDTWNLGTGRGYSVLEIVDAFETANGIKIPYTIQDRRAGDVAECYSVTKKAELELGWKAKLGLAEMMVDAWRWQKNNPHCYKY